MNENFIAVKYSSVTEWKKDRMTFIMSTTVLRAIMIMMEYSNGGETTNFHKRYWNDCWFCGIYRVNGLALIAKSMQALWEEKQ